MIKIVIKIKKKHLITLGVHPQDVESMESASVTSSQRANIISIVFPMTWMVTSLSTRNEA